MIKALAMDVRKTWNIMILGYTVGDKSNVVNYILKVSYSQMLLCLTLHLTNNYKCPQSIQGYID